MSVPQLVKQIHHLTYKEMLEVAEAISVRLMKFEMKERPGEPVAGPPLGVVADALLAITSDVDLNAQEEKLLRQLFSRKRTIAVELTGGGWKTDITTLQGAQAVGTTLRDSLNKTLDQIITLQALQK